MSGVARSRHQLSTLLKEAYENREALEERIAMGKRNRKEAGNKYGECIFAYTFSTCNEHATSRLLTGTYAAILITPLMPTVP
jgi:hypothetical protein